MLAPESLKRLFGLFGSTPMPKGELEEVMGVGYTSKEYENYFDVVELGIEARGGNRRISPEAILIRDFDFRSLREDYILARSYLDIKFISELVNEQKEDEFGLMITDLRDLSCRSRMRILKRRVHCSLPPIRDIRIRRDTLLEDAFEGIMRIPQFKLGSKFKIVFVREVGQDIDGLTRVLFHLVAVGLSDPSFGFFRFSSDSQERLEIDPTSRFDLGMSWSLKRIWHHYTRRMRILSLYKFLGRIIGFLLLRQETFDFELLPAYFKYMLGEELELSDLGDIDPILLKSMRYLDEADDDAIKDLKIYFSAPFIGTGNKSFVHNFVPNGRNIAVTKANKERYQKLFVEWRLMKSVRPQLRLIRAGIAEVIPLTTLREYFHNSKELRLTVCGESKIVIEDWKRYTQYVGFESIEIATWFWEVFYTC